jgi:hypothetical protein
MRSSSQFCWCLNLVLVSFFLFNTPFVIRTCEKYDLCDKNCGGFRMCEFSKGKVVFVQTSTVNYITGINTNSLIVTGINALSQR